MRLLDVMPEIRRAARAAWSTAATHSGCVSTARGAPRSTPMRSDAGGARQPSRTVAPAAARCRDRPGIAPAVTSSSAAASRTLRVTTNSTEKPAPALAEARAERVAAARRLEADQPAHGRRDRGSSRRRRWRAPPARCPPRPPRQSRRSSRRRCARCSTGCASAPNASGSVVGSSASSGVLVRPSETRPAALKRRVR